MKKNLEQAQIVEHRRVAEQTYRLRLHSPSISAEARAGQFVMVRLGTFHDPLLRRPFSFHRIDKNSGCFELLYRVVGRGTWSLTKSQEGQTLDCLGPLGNYFTLPEKSDVPVALVAGGIGIAPLVELMAAVTRSLKPGKTDRLRLFYGARTASELLPEEHLCPDVKIHYSTDDGSVGYCGFVTQLLEQIVSEEAITFGELYSCGTLAMQYNVARWTVQHNVAAQLSLESLMACGVGACLGCALPSAGSDSEQNEHYVHVCQDGPIFKPGSIQWNRIQPPQITPPAFVCR